MKSKTQRIVDMIVYIGLFALFAVVDASFIYKMVSGKPSPLLIIGTLAIAIAVIVAIIITVKKYGPYREKDEEAMPLIFYFLFFWLMDYPLDYVFDKVTLIAETSTNFTTGALKITAVLAITFIAVLIAIKGEVLLEKKYNQHKKAKKEQK